MGFGVEPKNVNVCKVGARNLTVGGRGTVDEEGEVRNRALKKIKLRVLSGFRVQGLALSVEGIGFCPKPYTLTTKRPNP